MVQDDEGSERLKRDEVMGGAARRTNPSVPVAQEDQVEHGETAAMARCARPRRRRPDFST
eukprot:667802-Prymnesium_polylepis.1